jgi:ankyrin repeat protein
MQAAGRGNLDVIRCLVNSLGADACADENGFTPMFVAA